MSQRNHQLSSGASNELIIQGLIGLFGQCFVIIINQCPIETINGYQMKVVDWSPIKVV